MRLCGLDEAGLGPSLGPFCACLTSFSLPEGSGPDEDLYRRLSGAVSRDGKAGGRDATARDRAAAAPDRGARNCAATARDGGGRGTAEPARVPVSDSKKLYSPAAGIGVLEYGVLSFLSAAGLGLPCSFTGLLEKLCPAGDLASMKETPWFRAAGESLLPRVRSAGDIAAGAERLLHSMAVSGVRMHLPSLRFITARQFNRELDEGPGKGEAVKNIITPLLRLAIGRDSRRADAARAECRRFDAPGADSSHNAAPGKPAEPARRIMVDRQGGRRYYGTWLAELMPGAPLRIIEEVPARSAYSAGRTSVEFRVGADGLFFETALASMIAKYVREIAMGLFNSWWHHRLPGIRPTAGYPADAKRFIADVESAGMMIDDRAMLIRRL